MGRKVTTQDFIERAKDRHKDKNYDYSKVKYIRNDVTVTIICPDHGEFEQQPNNHLQGKGCPTCAKTNRGLSQRSTTAEFVRKAKLAHKHKPYNYDKVIYETAILPVVIICLEHGEFEQTPNAHLSGGGCAKCTGRYKTNDEFIKQAGAKHKYIYDYSQTVYVDSTTKIDIICRIHGVFRQTPNSHLNERGCGWCGGSKKLTKDEFTDKASEKYDNTYDYSKVDYKNIDTNVTIICLEHGEFEQTPYNHIRASIGCPKCAGNSPGTTETFINQAIVVHGSKYDYSKVSYISTHHDVAIICPHHGEFRQTPSTHLRSVFGCPGCRQSKGEKYTASALDSLSLYYRRQHKFPDCKNIKPLPFDFYLPEFNVAIEYDGRQHYEATDFFGGEDGFRQRQINDEIKTEYCLHNNMSLLRIPYTTPVANIQDVVYDFLMSLPD